MGDGGLREVHTNAKHADHQKDALEQGGKSHPHLTSFHAHLRALSRGRFCNLVRGDDNWAAEHEETARRRII
jgi:hypothetical protein